MRTLWIISFRTPKLENEANAGGLVVALQPYFKASVEDKPFDQIAFCGFQDNTVPKANNEFKIETSDDPNIKVERYTLPISEEEKDKVYKKYLPVLWALHHNMLDKLDPDGLNYFSAWMELQSRLAESLAPHIKPDDIIWVQDYQLFSLGSKLRSKGIENLIGHFNHIPEISKQGLSRLYEAHPEIREHIEKQLHKIFLNRAEYDLSGQQRSIDVEKFLENLGAFPGPSTIYKTRKFQIAGTKITTGVFPASIDIKKDAAKAAEDLTGQEKQLFSSLNPDQPLIITAGRGDYSKGTDKLQEALKLLSPDAIFQAYIVATTTREGCFGYTEYIEGIRKNHKELQEKFGIENVILNEKGLPRDTLLKLQRKGIGVYVSHADGQNLAALEHVVSQNPYNPNVIITTEGTGISDLLPGAIVLKTNDPTEIHIALNRALEMPLEERVARHRTNMTSVMKYDANRFGQEFVNALLQQRHPQLVHAM